MDAQPVNQVSGLAPQDLQIVNARWDTFDRHLSSFFNQDRPWYVALRIPTSPNQRRLIEATLQSHIIKHVVIPRSSTWQQHVLLPLAADLGLVDQAERSVLALCIRRGWFDKIARPSVSLHPELDQILPLVREIRNTYHTTQDRIKALQHEGLCRDEKAAYEAAKELADPNVARYAISLLMNLLCSFATYDSIGLLRNSGHQFIEELLLLESQVQHIEVISSEPQHALIEIRRDIAALYHALTSVHPDLWQPDLLHARPGIQRRRDYRKNFYPRLRKRVLAVLVEIRGCDLITAELLLALFINSGLAGLIGWRCGLETETTVHAFERQRAFSALKRITSGLQQWAVAEITRLVSCLLLALQDAQVQFSFTPLLTEYPSSHRRQRWGRRIWFGLPAVMSRRRVYRRTKNSKENRRRSWDQHHYVVNRKQAVQLVEAFAKQAVLDEKDAQARLRDFLTYGVLGLLPRGQWQDVLDARLVSWLNLIKLGRLDGTVRWGPLTQQLHRYAAELGLPPPSHQVVRALFRSLPKPRYWHGGKGPAMYGIRQRATLVLHSRPRLHATWLVVTFIVKLRLSGLTEERYHMLLVVDDESELPVGGWLSKHQPGSREVALALYQAIWHPGMTQWPLHGMPEVIRVPAALVRDGIDDLQRASEYLLARLEIIDKISLEGRTRIRQIRRALQDVAAPTVRAQSQTQPIEEAVALRVLLEWLIPRCFPDHHAARVPAAVRAYNVSMPGYDTPAAGWLLPRTTSGETDTAGILVRGNRYSDERFRSEPYRQLQARELPADFPPPEGVTTTRGLFVETAQDNVVVLQYVIERA